MALKNHEKVDVLNEMIDEAYHENALSNWHMGDFFLDFQMKYYEKCKTNTARAGFNRLAKILVELDIIKKPNKVGIGAGGMNEFGTRTQTMWDYNFNITPDEAKKRLRGYLRMKGILE